MKCAFFFFSSLLLLPESLKDHNTGKKWELGKLDSHAKLCHLGEATPGNVLSNELF